MDGRDSAKCQNWEKKDIMVILEIVLNDNKTKGNSVVSYKSKRRKNVKWKRGKRCSR